MNSVLIFQLVVVLILFLLFCLLFRYNKSIKLENRLSRYSTSPVIYQKLSIGDHFTSYYKNILDKISFVIIKVPFLRKVSVRYEKYFRVAEHKKGIDFISEKIMVSILFLMIAFIIKLFTYEIINFYDVIFSLLIGFLTPNLIYVYKYKQYQNKLENDFLQAITIMNNAFKSGCSISQAIQIVTKELSGPMSNEFKKMHLEMNFGLSLEDVFKRFSQRVKIEEAIYLTSALIVLNKTGGNIIKVFSSIERTLFSKKTLKIELQSLTSSSKLIVNFLIAMPIIFAIVINFLNPNYFLPLYITVAGNIIVVIMGVIYMLYVYLVLKVLKVRF